MSVLGIIRRRPSASRPDLIAMQSSVARRFEFLITTVAQDSGLHPSVLPIPVVAVVVTPSTVTLLLRVGWNCQKRDPRSVTPWRSTLEQLYGSTKVERSVPCCGMTRWVGSVGN